MTQDGNRLLNAEAIRKEYGLGRDTVYRLLQVLPVVRIGRKRLVLRAVLEDFLRKASANGWDLRAIDEIPAVRPKKKGTGGRPDAHPR